jgi:hypothetical protein
MFWTAFVWGFGVSAGASIGLMLFGALYFVFWWIVDPDGMSKSESYRQYMMEAMAHRNEIAMEANDHLESIAASLCECETEDDDPFSDEYWRG